MSLENVFAPAEAAACRALIAGLDEAMNHEVVAVPAQRELFPGREPLSPAARLALRAFVAAANRDPTEQQPLDGTALLAALECLHYPGPEHPAFRSPHRLDVVKALLDGFGDAGPFRGGAGARVSTRLHQFAWQGTIALKHRERGNHPFGLPEEMHEQLPRVPDHAVPALARTRAEVFRALLAKPCRTDREGVTAIIAFGCLRFVLDTRLREARGESRRPGGSWQPYAATWLLDKPLHTMHWLGVLIHSQRGLLTDRVGRTLQEPDIRAVGERLAVEVDRSGLLPVCREIVKRHLPFDPAVLSVARGLSPSWGPRPTSTVHYTAVWQDQSAWTQVMRENAELAPLLFVLCRDGTVELHDAFQGLKRALLEAGIGRGGWKLLCAQGREACAEALSQSVTIGPGPKGHVARFVAFQARTLFAAGGTLPQPLLRSMLQNVLVLQRMETLQLPARFLALAVAEYLHRPTPMERERFVDEEWLPLLSWFAKVRPKIVPNQWAAGWMALHKAARAWARQTLADDGPPEWACEDRTFVGLDFFAVPLRSAAQLEVDGLKMAHCGASYAPACRAGGYRMFSARDIRTKKRIATIGIKAKPSGWEVHLVRGRCNSEGDEGVRRFAYKLAHSMNQGSDP